MELQEKLSAFLDKDGRLTAFPSKRKMKLYALIYLSKKFEGNKKYSEKEINQIINSFTLFEDPATVRRELFVYGFLNRKIDCSSYWLCEKQPTLKDLGLDEN